MKNRSITVHGAEVTITTRHEQDYISLMSFSEDGCTERQKPTAL